MDHLTRNHLLTLLNRPEPPCISLYQPTHRHHPDNQQDPIRFKNLVKKVEESLREKYPTRDVRGLMEPFQSLMVNNSRFWNHTRDGLALLAGPGLLKVFPLQRSLPERAIVADSFHVKPLLRYLQSADRFEVLALTKDSVAVFEGNRYALDAEDLPDDFPIDRETGVPETHTEPGVSVASSNFGVGGPKMYHGNTEGKDELDTEKFFRAVDRAVSDHFSKPSGRPLILAALPEHQAMFRKITQNPHLMAEGIASNPGAMNIEDLRKSAWKLLEPHYLTRLEKLKENFQTARARHAGTDDLSEAAKAAIGGRIATLLVEDERILAGVIDRTTGAIKSGDLAAPEVDDMLDDLAELVLVNGGEVVVVPAERMPTPSGLAAVYRY